MTALFMAQAHAEDVKMTYSGLILNANIEKAEEWPAGPVLLMTHGTLTHNKTELMTALQELCLENGTSTLAINLSLGLDDRHGPYDCAVPHSHKYEDAMQEIGAWLSWLKRQGEQQVILAGHSRGGNQTAWFSFWKQWDSILAYYLSSPCKRFYSCFFI